jgi:PleD family two-component response regulator
MQEPEHILVVDDEANIRTILTYLLEQEGFAVHQASDGQSALDLMRSDCPDLVILDVMMPDMDGLQVLAAMRGHFQTHNIPVILLTAKGDTPHKVQGLQEGANDYLVKPFVPQELILRVRNMLRFSKTQRDANPLTGLPGNRAITQEIERRLHSAEPFGFLYVDLDNFKAFNDHYGYSRGDKVLALLAESLQRATAEFEEESFLGHVGGDDFVAVVGAENASTVAHRLIREFDERKRFLYDPEDWSRGWIEIQDRTGTIRRMPPVTVTVALVVDREGEFGHIGRINAVAAELKRFGKAQAGSVVVEERRDAKVAENVVLNVAVDPDDATN